jgi:hypothetical protein
METTAQPVGAFGADAMGAGRLNADAALGAAGTISCGAPTGDWPQFRNVPTHSGYNATETTLSPSNVDALGVAWTATTGAAIWSSPAVANGVVYVGSSDGKLYAYAVGCNSGGGTCSPLWTATTGSGVESSPAIANGVVYVGSEDHKLYAYAVGCNSGGGSCTPLWTATTGISIWSSPAVADGVVYVGSYDDKLYAFGLPKGATYHPLTPTRILDSRSNLGFTGALSPNAAKTFQVTGVGGVPAGATAVTGNLTVTAQTAPGYLYIGPVAMNNPTSSTLNFPVGDDRANAVTVALSSTGSLSVTYVDPWTGQSAQAIFDVTGYFVP